MPLPANVHYFFVGEPSTGKDAGHDSIGPDLLHQAYPKQPITFWCLKDKKSNYEKHFKDSPTITVECIEDYVEQRDPVFFKLIEGLKQNAKEQVSSKDRIRELVTIKAAFQYFLQIETEGFMLDSNIVPAAGPTDEDSCIEKLSKFSYPLIRDTSDAGEYFRADPWLMYSPSKEDNPLAKKDAIQRFKHYFDSIASGRAKRKTFNQIDRVALGKAFVDSALIAPSRSDAIQVEFHSDAVEILTFRKRYYNTHHLPKAGVIHPPITHNILGGKFRSLDELMYIIQKRKEDPSAVYHYRGSPEDGMMEMTLLHLAILKNEPQALSAMLPLASNPYTVIVLPERKKEPLSLIDIALLVGDLKQKAKAIEYLIDNDIAFHGFKDEGAYVETLKLIERFMPETGDDPFEASSVEDLVGEIAFDPDRHFMMALKLIQKHGVLTKDSLNDYCEDIKAIFSKQREHTHTFFGSAIDFFDEKELRSQAEVLISTQMTKDM
jgi:hypothetical protein